MSAIRMSLNTFLAALATALCVVGTAFAQPTTIIAAELARPGQLLSSPKDAELRASLAAVPARWDGLVESLGEPELKRAAPFVEQFFTLVSHPMRFAVTDAGADPNTGAPGIGVALDVDFDSRDDAQAFHEQVRGALRATGAPEFEQSATRPGSLAFQTPLGEATFGPARDADGSWGYRLLMGKTERTLDVFPIEGGEGSIASLELNLGALTPMIEPVLRAENPEMVDFLAGVGLLGEDAFSVQYAASHEGDALVHQTRVIGGAKYMSGMGLADGFAIRDQDLHILPSTAVMGYVFGLDASPLSGMLDSMRAEIGELDEALSQLEARTGMSIPGDLVEPLAPLCAFYTSAETGSVGLLGSVLVMQLDDAPAFANRVGRLADELNRYAREALEEPRRRAGIGVRVRRTDHPQGIAYTFQVPGLPIPAEPTLMVGERFATLALWPAGAHVANNQAHGRGDAGLLANPRIARDLAAPGPRTAIEFYDGPALMDRGYPVASMVLTALANGVRSPEDVSRGPSRAIPSYAELASSARASTAVTWVDGDDLRTRSVNDASQTVMLTQVAPLFANMQVMVLPMMVGILLPALDRARSNAELLKDGTQLKMIHVAATTYATMHNDRFPDSFEPLLEDGTIVPETLVSPLGSVGDGHGDYFLKPGARLTFNAREVQGYSRSSYMYGTGVNVVFGDNHVMFMDFVEFLEILDEAPNDKVDWNLPF